MKKLDNGVKLAKTLAFDSCRFVKIKKPSGIKYYAFTLAETLITLAIVGIIAMITIPTLMSKYQKHVFTTRLLNAYTNVQNAFKMVPITENCPAGDYDCAGWNDANPIDGKIFKNRGEKQIYLLSKNLKVAKFCFNNNGTECQGFPYKFAEVTSESQYKMEPSIVTDDGVSVTSSGGGGYAIKLDINGKAGPNESGRDLFYFTPASTQAFNSSNGFVLESGVIVPHGSELCKMVSGYPGLYIGGSGQICTYSNWKNCTSGTSDRANCAARVLMERKMDY